MLVLKSICICAVLAARCALASSSHDFSPAAGLSAGHLKLAQDALVTTGDDIDLDEVNEEIACQNSGKLQQKDWVSQGCDPTKSIGFTSSHNCVNKKSGKAYFCYYRGTKMCVNGRSLVKADMENGECFK
ncbi:hypothetical protein FA95DRAFT_565933 [Auriscalpium vulgare]|uniref:Uncharacterized protein n=1 Tax=Auriscalpium vulgare TaxID=40419 RepID=A0ACB8RE09_9AGAM|nr:hypothetical protein FA95DRAFT_565933 [Auriscalpium vulgare]